MKTELLVTDPHHIDPAIIERAAALLRAGQVVAFPTETVYGLGADALNDAAVAAVFVAKGRPSNNPVIVHVADVSAARRIVSDWPTAADQLAARFWPGPLTMVLPKAPCVPVIVTAGGATVAVRVPAHPVALALIRAAGAPLAAPSANRSGYISPTRAAHVLRSLAGRIPMILDGGSTTGGLESTVIDLSVSQPRILRPGLISEAELRSLVPDLEGFSPPTNPAHEQSAAPLRSPGQLARHYAPQAMVELLPDHRSAAARVATLLDRGLSVGWLSRVEDVDSRANLRRVWMGAGADTYAALLYARLHDLDAVGVDRIIIELPPAGDEWAAIRDRLRRASTAE